MLLHPVVCNWSFFPHVFVSFCASPHAATNVTDITIPTLSFANSPSPFPKALKRSRLGQVYTVPPSPPPLPGLLPLVPLVVFSPFSFPIKGLVDRRRPLHSTTFHSWGFYNSPLTWLGHVLCWFAPPEVALVVLVTQQPESSSAFQ